MKKISIAIFLTILVAAPGYSQKSEDEKNALAVVNQLFAEMAAANPAGILALQMPEAQLVAIYPKTNDGKSRIRSISADAFSKMFTKKEMSLKEHMYDPKVEIHGDLALVWGRYVFHAGDKLSHCGVNTFNLVRSEGVWKIANGASTIDPGDCSEKEKAMKPTLAK